MKITKLTKIRDKIIQQNFENKMPKSSKIIKNYKNLKNQKENSSNIHNNSQKLQENTKKSQNIHKNH